MKPPCIDERHWEEWVIGSCIDPEIAALNLISVSGSAGYNRLLYSENLKRSNTGRLSSGMLYRYHHIEDGGWWHSGISLDTFEDSQWGCLKPDTPFIDAERERPIKYEHPPKVATEVFAPRVPSRIWEEIAQRYNIALPDNFQNSPYGEFWKWVIAHSQIDICITEGVKKTAAILSQGFVAIGLPGITAGFRTPRNDEGDRTGKSYLIPQLEIFAQKGRNFIFCFDAESRHTTAQAVDKAVETTGKLLQKHGCKIRVMQWEPRLGKGIDDVIIGAGIAGKEVFSLLYKDVLAFDKWQTNRLRKLSYAPDILLNQRYLGDINIPAGTKLVGIKSPKGTGKTYFLKQKLDPYISSGGRVLVITHRVQLGLQISEALGIPFISELKGMDAAEKLASQYNGLVLCIDSLHQFSSIKFDPSKWEGCRIVLDECNQLIWHLLNSKTDVRKHRVKIINNFKQLLQNANQILSSDADLNDISLDFLTNLMEDKAKPFIISNEFKFNEPWRIFNFGGKNPALLIAALERKLEQGKRIFLCVSGQKASSKWGSKNLSKYFQQKYPWLRVLTIDSESVTTPGDPAFRCTRDLNNLLDKDHEFWENLSCPINACPIDQSVQVKKIEIDTQTDLFSKKQYDQCELIPNIKSRDRTDFDLVIATQVVETGVSIEVDTFDYVFGIFQGVSAADSVRQHLSRVRSPIDRYIWIAPRGINQNRIGNGSSDYKMLIYNEHTKDKLNISHLVKAGFSENINGDFEPICLTTWAKMGAIINAGMRDYADSILADLEAEGHIIVPASDEDIDIDSAIIGDKAEAAEEAVTECRNINYENHCNDIAVISTPADESKREDLKRKQEKSEKERLASRKIQLEERYRVEITPDIVKRDDNGWYSELRLHYYFSDGRSYLSDFDKRILERMLESSGNGQYFKPDLNSSQLSLKIHFLDILGVRKLLQISQITEDDELAQDIYSKSRKYAYHLKNILGIGFDWDKPPSPIMVCQRLLNLFGLSMPCIKRQNKKGDRTRVYGAPAPDFERNEKGKLLIKDGAAIAKDDGRIEIFQKWIERDQELLLKRQQEQLGRQMQAQENQVPDSSAGEAIAPAPTSPAPPTHPDPHQDPVGYTDWILANHSADPVDPQSLNPSELWRNRLAAAAQMERWISGFALRVYAIFHNLNLQNALDIFSELEEEYREVFVNVCSTMEAA